VAGAAQRPSSNVAGWAASPDVRQKNRQLNYPKNVVWQLLTPAQQKGDENNEVNTCLVNTRDSIVRNRTLQPKTRQTTLCTHLNYKQNK